MAGRINEEDIALVRERSRIDDVVSPYVTLRRAGAGSLKGLCPFHDEKTPSFQVTPARGLYYCFGCGEGGDAISFLQKKENLSFVEAVERLADQFNVQLRYIDDGSRTAETGNRRRITEANRLAAEFYAHQLTSPDALVGRRFLDGRGFDRQAAEHFGIGFAPRGGRDLHAFLRQRGFRDDELVRAGLVRENGGWDFFQGRLLWPIRDAGGVVLGFGARRLFDDDRMPAKYLNTPETAVYKKSHVLYGLDLARQPIAKKSQAVVVEGYTDVMAAHLSGVDTAVASCGTAFGDDHARILQRLLGQTSATQGEVIFTFDGDAAGQAAALKVFKGDQNFITQTYVAVEPHGWDPCDLRINEGDAAVRELVGRRVPLYRFVMDNVIGEFDLDRADGRVAALRAAAPLVAAIRDRSLVAAYVHELAGLLGLDLEDVRREVARAERGGQGAQRQGGQRDGSGSVDVVTEPMVGQPGPAGGIPGETAVTPLLPLPDPRDPRLVVERGTVQLLVQVPWMFSPDWGGLEADDFAHPAYRRIAQTARLVFSMYGEPSGEVPDGFDPAAWIHLLREGCDDANAEQVLIALSVEPLLRDPDPLYADAYAARLQLQRVNEAIGALKGRMQRTNPIEQAEEHRRMFTDLLAWETARKDLQARSFAVPD
ncbi:DNA primase [Raineyella fluvialis]|uniref:DNA primase n=1 Tax=Raineyella fluvialis TaxID=2662261 RepID=A0A5Q2FC76_9ACTN|nr:DNA primase [Raineyella fluvialis]QGF24368.1 DNA primase [Raineyella fluvialis]